MLDRYELSEVIESGAFTTVWRAHDPMLDIEVAIELLNDDSAGDPDMREQFLTEARLALQDTSPDSVRVHHVAESADRNIPYIVTALAESTTPSPLAGTPNEPAMSEAEPEVGRPGFVGESMLPSAGKMLAVLAVVMLVPAAIIGALVVGNLSGDIEPAEDPAATATPASVGLGADDGQRIPEDFPVPEGAALDSDLSVDGRLLVYTIGGNPDRLVLMYSLFEGWRVESSSQTGNTASVIVSDGANDVSVIAEPVDSESGADITKLTVTPAGDQPG